MTGAELLVRCLEREGVRYVFGVPGEETLDVNEALAHSSIRFVPVRHEQAAAFMADVWGRLTGHAGVCLATLGPGATNLATGVADANLDRAPVVAITGQLARHLLHKESHQYVDIVDVFRPFTKWNARIGTGAVVAEAVRKAFKRAQEEKPGACHLELPEDVAQEPAEGEPLAADRPRRPSPDRPSLARAADIINQAKRPLILAGNGVIRGLASKELTALAERAQMPVVTTFMAKGAISPDHPLAKTTVGLASDDPARLGFASADLVIAVGYDPVEYGPAKWNESGRLEVVHVDFQAAAVNARHRRRGLPDERPGARDGGSAGAGLGGADLPRRRLWRDPLEAGAAVRANGGGRLRQPGFRRPRARVRLRRCPDRCRQGAAARPRGRAPGGGAR